MIAIIYTEIDFNSNPIFEEQFLNDFRNSAEWIRFIVSSQYANLVEEKNKDNLIVINSNAEIINVLSEGGYEYVLMQQDNNEISAGVKDAGIDVYFRSGEEYFNKYYRMKQKNEELQGQLTECQNYINSLSIHATKIDNELKKYKSMFEDENNMVEALKRAAKQKKEYLDLYRGVLDKLDALTVENLNLKKKR